jgi:hypothetical protein
MITHPFSTLPASTLTGLAHGGGLPRVARSSQPWAICSPPFQGGPRGKSLRGPGLSILGSPPLPYGYGGCRIEHPHGENKKLRRKQRGIGIRFLRASRALATHARVAYPGHPKKAPSPGGRRLPTTRRKRRGIDPNEIEWLLFLQRPLRKSFLSEPVILSGAIQTAPSPGGRRSATELIPRQARDDKRRRNEFRRGFLQGDVEVALRIYLGGR